VPPPPPGTRVSPAESIGIAGIVILAAVLRFTALGSGVPAAVGSDEPFIMEKAVSMMKSGEFNPGIFDYPSLYFYMQTAVATARYLAGTLSGEWFHLNDVIGADFYLWGRALTATLGTLTIVLVWRVGRRLGVAAGLLGALFLTIQPQHVRESHFVLTDVPMTCFVTLALLLSLRAADVRTVSAFGWAGIAVGLAAATKYTAVLAILMPLVVLLLTPREQVHQLRAALAIVGGAAMTYLVAAPYTVLDLPAFLNGFGHLAMSYVKAAEPSPPAWQTYLLHLRVNIGWPLLLLAIAAVVIAPWQVSRRRDASRFVWAAGAIFVAVFFLSISRQKLIFGRYLLPILPPLLVLAAGMLVLAVAWLRARLPARRLWPLALTSAIVVAVITVPVSRTSSILSTMSKVSSNEMAYQWILKNVPPGSRVIVEAEGMMLPRIYRGRNVARLVDEDFNAYVAEGATHFVASSQASGGAVRGGTSPLAQQYRELFRRLELVFSVAPSADHPGSEILIYRLTPRDP
jgi:4-amino-4-deoxy-L-arabinose transferase-like glycosyltransferase